jgi:outer membrane protein OmpA-like peptidoglycan-associated protein
MRPSISLSLVAAVLWLFAGGCATEEWTYQLFAKRNAEVDERFVKVETDVREQHQRLDRIETRLPDLETAGADRRSPLKGALPPGRSTIVARNSTSTGAPLAQRILIRVVHVPFAFDSDDLDARAEMALAFIVKELRNTADMTVDLEGTTDPMGSRDYNVKLSQRRIEAVKRSLAHRGVDPTRIVTSMARGPLVEASVKDDLKRRVLVKLLRPSE